MVINGDIKVAFFDRLLIVLYVVARFGFINRPFDRAEKAGLSHAQRMSSPSTKRMRKTPEDGKVPESFPSTRPELVPPLHTLNNTLCGLHASRSSWANYGLQKTDDAQMVRL